MFGVADRSVGHYNVPSTKSTLGDIQPLESFLRTNDPGYERRIRGDVQGSSVLRKKMEGNTREGNANRREGSGEEMRRRFGGGYTISLTPSGLTWDGRAAGLGCKK